MAIPRNSYLPSYLHDFIVTKWVHTSYILCIQVKLSPSNKVMCKTSFNDTESEISAGLG